MYKIFALFVICSHLVQSLPDESTLQCVVDWDGDTPWEMLPRTYASDLSDDWPNNLKSLKSQEYDAADDFYDKNRDCFNQGGVKCAEASKAYDKFVLKNVERLETHINYTKVLITEKADRLEHLLSQGNEYGSIRASGDLYRRKKILADLLENRADIMDIWCLRYNKCKCGHNDSELCRSLLEMATHCPQNVTPAFKTSTSEGTMIENIE